jgi:hypothetical protein
MPKNDKNKDNHSLTIKTISAEVLDEYLSEHEVDEKPLTPEEFEDGLRRFNALGLTFSTDLMPVIIPKDEKASELIDVTGLEKIEKDYPNLPVEVGLVAHNEITGSRYGLEMLGGLEAFERKALIVNELVINDKYRSNFFFNYALKVPFLESIDWEVNFKTHERGVDGFVGTPYALLMMTLHNSNHKVQDKHQTITAAVNLELIDKALTALTEVRAALEESNRIREVVVKSNKLLKE